jgi:hypothetical protein
MMWRLQSITTWPVSKVSFEPLNDSFFSFSKPPVFEFKILEVNCCGAYGLKVQPSGVFASIFEKCYMAHF